MKKKSAIKPGDRATFHGTECVVVLLHGDEAVVHFPQHRLGARYEVIASGWLVRT